MSARVHSSSEKRVVSPGASTRPPDPRGPATVEAGWSPLGLQAIVEAARGQIAEENYDQAEQTLRPVLGHFAEAGAAGSDELAQRQLRITAATAHSLLGRCHAVAHRTDDAADAFRTSAELFEALASTHELTPRDWADYGEALEALGRDEEAIDALSRARDGGFLTADSLRKLGTLKFTHRAYEEAETVLRAAVDLTAVDWQAALELAKVLEARGAAGAASELFQEAGRRAASGGALQPALDAFGRASELAPTDPNPLLAIGDVLRSQGRLEEACNVLDSALDLEPSSPWGLGTRGQIMLALGDSAAALADLERAAQLAPRPDWIPLTLAAALYGEGRVDEAMRIVDEAVGQAPDSPAPLITRASLLVTSGRLDEALQTIEQALVHTPEDSRALAIKGEILRLTGHNRKALKALDRAIANADGQFPWALASRGQALQALGRRDEARDAFEQALDQDRTLTWAVLEFAGVLLQLGELEAALQQANSALETVTDAVSALVLRSRILLAMGRHREARDTASSAVELDRDSLPARLALAEALCKSGELDSAQREADSIVALAPNSADAHAVRASVLLEAERVDDAVGEIKSVARLDPGDTSRIASFADKLRVRDRHQDARTVLEDVLEQAPNDIGGLSVLGNVLLDIGAFEEAASTLTLLQSLVEDDPAALADASADLAYAHHGCDACRAALSAVQTALSANPDHTWALTVFGLILIDMGQFDAALRPLRRATTLEPDRILSVHATGWALQQLGTDHAAEAHEAYRRAYEMDPDDLYTLRGIADTRPPSQAAAAAAEYQEIIERSGSRQPDRDLLSLIGWSNFGLRRYDDAIDLHLTAISRSAPSSADAVTFQLDLALAMLAAGKRELATEEYERARRLSQELAPERRRGVLAIAIADLDWAVAYDHVAPASVDRTLRELADDILELDAAEDRPSLAEYESAVGQIQERVL